MSYIDAECSRLIPGCISSIDAGMQSDGGICVRIGSVGDVAVSNEALYSHTVNSPSKGGNLISSENKKHDVSVLVQKVPSP